MLLDLNRIIMEAVSDQLTRAKKDTYDLKNAMINTYSMFIETGKTKYDKTGKKSAPSANIVYTAIFTNKTHNPQVYTLNTTRETNSVYEFSFSTTWTFGAQLEIKVPVPNMGNFNFSFGAKHSSQNGNKVTSQHQITWGIDSKVTVPGKHWVMANLVITEEDFQSDFEMTTTFDGQIVVLLGKKKKDIVDRIEDAINKHVYLVDFQGMTKEGYEEIRLDVRNIFTTRHGFVVDDRGRPTFKTKGECKCRIGVEQEIIVSEYFGAPPEDDDGTMKSLDKEMARKKQPGVEPQ